MAFDKTIKRLEAFSDRAEDLSALQEPITEVLLVENRRRGLIGHDYNDEPYADLKPSTIADRANRGYPAGPPLNRRGEDAQVIQGCTVESSHQPGRLEFVKGWPLVTWIRYAIKGTPNMAARNPAGWGQAELTRVRQMLVRHVTGRRK